MIPDSTPRSQGSLGPGAGRRVAAGDRRRRQRRQQLRYLAAAAAAVVVLTGATAAVWTLSPLRDRHLDIARVLPPLSPFSYLAHDSRSGHVDHHVLYHGLENTAEHLRDADVLLLGNSRLMFAFPSENVRRFFRERGLDYYVLGFGHIEDNIFPERIIERHDLRPSLVIVNADEFFTDTHSEWAGRVMRASYFDAAKYQWEAELTHRVRRTLHDLVPHFIEAYRNEPEFIVYRSSLDGTWDVEWTRQALPGARIPEESGAEPRLLEHEIEAAGRFKAEMDRRGAALVLTSVPSPRTSRRRAERLAAILGVPLVAPRPAGLEHFDGSHLTEESGVRFSEAFLAELDPILHRLGLIDPPDFSSIP